MISNQVRKRSRIENDLSTGKKSQNISRLEERIGLTLHILNLKFLMVNSCVTAFDFLSEIFHGLNRVCAESLIENMIICSKILKEPRKKLQKKRPSPHIHSIGGPLLIPKNTSPNMNVTGRFFSLFFPRFIENYSYLFFESSK